MQIDELSNFEIPKQYIEKFKQQGIKQLHDPQIKSLKKDLLKNKNQIIAAPTASGKTLIATLAIIKILAQKQKAIYLVPLVALAGEKFKYYKNLFAGSGIKVAISTGDLDSRSQWLSNYDLILLTTEKCDSLMRHNANWIKEIGLVIVDEIHMLQDPSRGPTLEITITRLKEIIPHSQFLGLSATIKNSEEIAEWLDAESIVSDFRPVKLYEGMYMDSKIHFFEKDGYDLNNILSPEIAIFENTSQLKKQALYFVSTRRNAESLAEKLSKFNENYIRKEKLDLMNLSDEVKNVLEVPTIQCKKLSDCVKNGIAFHHAGLLHEQKKLIEDNFRNGLIKSIVATPTLAMGVNLPAFRVVIRDPKRYYTGYGSRFIPVLEYKQFVGRAGRPEYDSFGESLLIAKSEPESHELKERFILGEPEDIFSKLSLEPVLRMHTLSLIASGFVNTQDSLLDFFKKTFYAHQYKDIFEIKIKIEEIIEILIKFKFLVEENDKIIPTRIGKRVSELYIDPLTANHFIKSLRKTEKTRPKEFSILHMVSNTLEMRPLLSITNKDFENISNKISSSMFLQKIPSEWDLEFDDFSRSVKTAMIFESWINEKTGDQILTNYKVTPGELRTRLKNADWLLYSANELALLLEMKDILLNLRKTRVRIKYGIKEELVALVRLKKIGRARARRLYSSGLKTISDLRKVSLEKLQNIIGQNIAFEIKRQLGEEVEKPKQEKQSALFAYKGL